MSESQQPRDLQTKPLTPPDIEAVIHAVAMLDGSVDSFQAPEVRRAALLDTLEDLNARMKSREGLPVRALLLGGHTSLLEDVAAIRDDLLALLAIFNAGGRLGIGPWYTLVDDTLVSGESLIRNLLAARADSRRYGLNLLPVAYLPASTGHAAQLPQILRGFKLGVALLAAATDAHNTPDHFVNWEAPGDSHVQVIAAPGSAGWPRPPVTAEQVVRDIQAQRDRWDGPILWLYDVNATAELPADFAAQIKARTELQLVAADLEDYLSDWRVALIAADQPAHKRAIRRGYYGQVSARLHLKQTHARLQAELVHHVEPWLAIALTHGQPAHPQNLTALLDYAWRLLLRNQAVEVLGGGAVDEVQSTIELRSQQIDHASREIVARALDALPGTPQRGDVPATVETLHLVAWNAHNWPRAEVVEVELPLPPDRHPARLLDPDGAETLFAWEAFAAGGGRLIFRAQAPAVGCASYSLHVHDDPPPSSCAVSRAAGDSISNVNGDRLSVVDGALHWHSGGHEIADVLRFVDGGDAGDIFDYCAPQPDVIEEAKLAGEVEVESCPRF